MKRDISFKIWVSTIVIALISTLSIPVANAGKPTVGQLCFYNDYAYPTVKVRVNPGNIPGGTNTVLYNINFYELNGNGEHINVYSQGLTTTKRPSGLILDTFTNLSIYSYNISKIDVNVNYFSSNGTFKGSSTLDNCVRTSW